MLYGDATERVLVEGSYRAARASGGTSNSLTTRGLTFDVPSERALTLKIPVPRNNVRQFSFAKLERDKRSATSEARHAI